MSNVKKIPCENITENLIEEYESKGFELVSQEYVMEHSLLDIPQIEAPFPLTVISWSTALERGFYEVYQASFKDRPGFPGWSMEKWVEWVSTGGDFLRDRSYLATVNNESVGFITVGKESDKIGFIIQVGVIPEWRGKGIAAILTCKCLEAFRLDGMISATLHVNQNNPRAIKLYESLGFKIAHKRGTFAKKDDCKASPE
ncbi:GNAT family N-acetyltransferase [Rossellomorea vietnamensis]|uniref:GNAT family N-acetyltransferase n=1 Tax=Rossellomorea vietnamensis TaxID=218284 RepID=A0A6I6UV15_9BACI|nr:N-acetyltransferase [Rossellomorea vietnamensis]QHE62676.1 GNAT family N-acetyltransferase [Rossellomorea vietnamensis]